MLSKSPKTILLIVCLLLSACCLSGCWDNKELKNIDVVASLGLDYAPAMEEKGNPLKEVSVEVLKADKALEAGNKDSSRFYYGSGQSVLEAIDSLYAQGAKELSWPHNRLLVLGQSVGQVSAADYLDYFIRSYEIRPTTLLAMSEGTAKELLASVDSSSVTASSTILTVLDKKEQGVEESFLRVTLQDFVNGLLDTGLDPVLPLIEQAGAEEGVRIQRLMAFRQGKAIGTLNPKETRGVLWVKNRMEHGVIAVNDGNQQQSLDVLSSQCKLKAVGSGKPVVRLYVEVKAGLKEDSNMLSTQPSTQHEQEVAMTNAVEDMESAMNQAIAAEIQLAVQRSQALDSDFLGLGQTIYRQQPGFWLSLPTEGYLKEIQTDVEVNCQVVFLGDTARSFGR